MIKYKNMNLQSADRIRELYFDNNLRYTQKELGEMYGISQGNVLSIVSGGA